MALAGVAALPAVCLPGALLVSAGLTSNLFSLALWQAVPNPLGVHLAGSVLHFNLADVCIGVGGLVVLLSVALTPAERFGGSNGQLDC